MSTSRLAYRVSGKNIFERKMGRVPGKMGLTCTSERTICTCYGDYAPGLIVKALNAYEDRRRQLVANKAALLVRPAGSLEVPPTPWHFEVNTSVFNEDENPDDLDIALLDAGGVIRGSIACQSEMDIADGLSRGAMARMAAMMTAAPELCAALRPVLEEVYDGDRDLVETTRRDTYNPDAHVEITLSYAEVWAIKDALDKAKGGTQ